MSHALVLSLASTSEESYPLPERSIAHVSLLRSDPDAARRTRRSSEAGACLRLVVALAVPPERQSAASDASACFSRSLGTSSSRTGAQGTHSLTPGEAGVIA